MDMTVKDVIKMLYVACEGDLDMPFLGVCLGGVKNYIDVLNL